VGRPTVEQALAVAPDARSAAAGERLALATAWAEVGHDDRAVWGACRGSGKAPYQVAVDLWGPAYRCTCPSRKWPCKHAIALLLLWARDSPVVVAAAAPAEVGAWLASRAAATPGGLERAVAGNAAALVAAPPVAAEPDPEAAAARVVRRTERIVAGMAELDRWLSDLIRQGLGRAQSLPYAFWDDMGARLVDAQAPGAAGRVRNLAGVVRSGDGWPERLLGEVARLHLLAAGWRHLDALPDAVRADLRHAAGWPWREDEVLAAGPRERDRWYVFGRSITDEERVRVQRSWLWGLDSGRIGVLVDFARPGAAFSWELWPGNVLDADVARYPGSAQLRVLVAEKHGEPEPGGAPPAWDDLGEVAAARGLAVAADPWIARWPVSLRGAVPDGRPGLWRVVDRGGRQLPLATDDATAWQLLALSGGRPVDLVGEWEDGRLRPLGAWVDDEMVVV
jgi:hypothetical protein